MQFKVDFYKLDIKLSLILKYNKLFMTLIWCCT